jgi:hypothetical protein
MRTASTSAMFRFFNTLIPLHKLCCGVGYPNRRLLAAQRTPERDLSSLDKAPIHIQLGSGEFSADGAGERRCSSVGPSVTTPKTGRELALLK